MVLAMMLPLMLIPARLTAFASLWRRRHQAMGVFLVGYTLVWSVAGLGFILLLTWLREFHVTPGRWEAGGVFLAATVWQCTALKQRFSMACHRTMPLAPDGWQAQRDCLQYGAYQGVYCVGNCGPVMLAAMLSPWHQVMMIAVTLLLLYERYRARPGSRTVRVVPGLLAVCQFVI
jgi:predicted metal-binding membrane protein